MRIVVDMNLSPDWCAVLNGHGHEAVHWSNIGDPHAIDSEIMSWAADHRFLVLTHDLDFGTILATSGANGPSVVQLRTEDTLAAHLGNIVVAVLEEQKAALEAGAIVVIEEWRSRVRILPLDG
jgi:predicted nuclease of predicted toxin-antitoxin system